MNKEEYIKKLFDDIDEMDCEELREYAKRIEANAQSYFHNWKECNDKLSERQTTNNILNSSSEKALSIADISKRFSLEQQKAVKYVVDELFAYMRGEMGIDIDKKTIDIAFEDISENVFS